jgi:anti-anti-sigma factor
MRSAALRANDIDDARRGDDCGEQVLGGRGHPVRPAVSSADQEASRPHQLVINATVVDRGVAVLGVAGEIDILSSNELRTRVQRALGDPHRHLVLDLTGVRFMDSHGLSALLRIAEVARQRHIALWIVLERGQPARRPIELSGLTGVLRVHDSLADALRHLAATERDGG